MISPVVLAVSLVTQAAVDLPRLSAVEAPGGRFVVAVQDSMLVAVFDASLRRAPIDAELQSCLRERSGSQPPVELAGRGVLVGGCVVGASGVRPATAADAAWTWARAARPVEEQFVARFRSSPAFSELRRQWLVEGLMGVERDERCGAQLGHSQHGVVVMKPDGGLDEASSLALVGDDFVVDAAVGGLSVHRRGSLPNSVCPTGEDYDLLVATRCARGRFTVREVPKVDRSVNIGQRKSTLSFAEQAAPDAGVLEVGDGWALRDATPGGAWVLTHGGVVDPKRSAQLHQLITGACVDWPTFQPTAASLLVSDLDRVSYVTRCSVMYVGCELGVELPSLRKLSGPETCLAAASIAGEASVPNEPTTEDWLRDCVVRFPESGAAERALAATLEKQGRVEDAQAHRELGRLKDQTRR
ncbi:MAG: hypothetical protein U0228_34835 [Myxococcaceae bacterium]